MRKRKRLRDAERLGSVLARDKGVGKIIEGAYGPVPPATWEEAVGSRIARRTRPKRLVKGTLFVVASSAAWAQELSLLSENIISALATKVPSVRQLRFEVGDVEPLAEPRGRLVPAPPKAPLPATLSVALSHVSDDELRASIQDAASRNLGFEYAAMNARERENARRRRRAPI